MQKPLVHHRRKLRYNKDSTADPAGAETNIRERKRNTLCCTFTRCHAAGHLPALRRYYKSCRIPASANTLPSSKLMWRSHLHPSWAEGAGCLIVRNFIDGRVLSIDYPVPGPDGDEDAALTAHRGRTAAERDIRPRPLRRPAGQGGAPCRRRYPYVSAFPRPRVWQRLYLPPPRICANFAGRRYSGQRNHINKFRKLYPDARLPPARDEQTCRSSTQLLPRLRRRSFTKADRSRAEQRAELRRGDADRMAGQPCASSCGGM